MAGAGDRRSGDLRYRVRRAVGVSAGDPRGCQCHAGAAAILRGACPYWHHTSRAGPRMGGAVFVTAVGLGPFPGALALAVHSVGMLGRLFAEVIEDMDMGPVEALTLTGAGRLQVFSQAVVPGSCRRSWASACSASTKTCVCASDKSPLGHHLDQIALAELVAKVAAHAENNDLPIKMPTIEQPLQTLPLAYHRPPDWLHSYFNRSNEPICTRTQKPLEPIPLDTGSHIRKGRLNFGARLRCLPHAVLLACFLSSPTHITIARLADLTATELSMLGKTINLRWKIVAFLTLPLPSPANLIADPCAYHPGKPSRAVAAVRSRRSSIK